MYIQKAALCKVAQRKIEITKNEEKQKQKGKSNYKEKES